VKALELTVYPRRFVETGFARWNGDGTFTPLHVPEWFINGEWNRFPRTEDKRLTDAELAAEYWLLSSRRQRMLGYHDGPDSETRKQARIDEDRMKVVERFATLPHYDEKEMNA
jgi:hypothetical protein